MNQDELEKVAAFASLAPSVHNTQPWQFVATGQTLQVRACPDRQLPFLDDTSRQLHISCGAAVEFGRLAIAVLGYSCVLRLLPNQEDPLVVATLTPGFPLVASKEECRLFDAAPRRYTDRGPYDDTPVPFRTLARMFEVAADVGCWLRTLNRPGDRLLTAVVLERADAIERADPRYWDELDRWRRDDKADDGVPQVAAANWPDDRSPDLRLRDFARNPRQRQRGHLDERPDVERDTLVLLGSDADDRLSWLRTGRALAKVLLIATEAGLATQPLGQATDLELTRTQLQHGLGLLGYPQLLLRVGYGHGQPTTGRRPLADMLTTGAVA